MLKTVALDKRAKLTHSADFLTLCQAAAREVNEVCGDYVASRSLQGDSILIDVRDRDELQAQGYIDGAYHISKGWLEAQIHRVTEDKNMEIILYCGSGKRSLLAAKNLIRMGYHNVKSLQGGFKGFVQSGFEVQEGQ